jgi:hypothetical protein
MSKLEDVISVVPLRKGQRKTANHWMSMAAKHPEMDHYSLPYYEIGLPLFHMSLAI